MGRWGPRGSLFPMLAPGHVVPAEAGRWREAEKHHLLQSCQPHQARGSRKGDRAASDMRLSAFAHTRGGRAPGRGGGRRGTAGPDIQKAREGARGPVCGPKGTPPGRARHCPCHQPRMGVEAGPALSGDPSLPRVSVLVTAASLPGGLAAAPHREGRWSSYQRHKLGSPC